ncbi:MAG: sirohydrochlorin cobaltochelatase [Methanothrix sp.]|nr:sirohydrochlorin cobaltochelatase [Methanothrix sp.]
MKRVRVGMAAMLALAFIAPTNVAMDRPAKDESAILLVMFGTSYPEAQAAYENIERIYKMEFPDAKIQIAFTSDYIRRKIQERDNISIDNPLTALSRLNDEGYVNVVVQSLHVIPGEEFHDMANIVDSIKGIEGKFGFKNLTIGMPLLMSNDDYRNVSAALASQFDECTTGTNRTPQKSPRDADDTAVVFMGHGTEHPANSAYCQMANILAEDHKNVFMGTVEGYPTFEDVLEDLKESEVKNVRLMPFMIVAGDHALNDLTGNESDSWKSMFEKEGIHVDFNLKGMGENDGIAEIFVQHTKEAFKEFR